MNPLLLSPFSFSDFWNYPMAKFCRRSLLVAEGRGTRSCERSNERREGEEKRQLIGGSCFKTEMASDESVGGGIDLAALSARLSQQLEELSRMSSSSSPSPSSSPLPPISPTRPARRSCGRVDTPTTSPLSTPPMRQRRRVSDSSVVMRVEPGRACRGRGASLAGITSKHKYSAFVDYFMMMVQSIMICVFVWTILRTCQIVHMKSKQIDVYGNNYEHTNRQRRCKSPVGGVASVHGRPAEQGCQAEQQPAAEQHQAAAAEAEEALHLPSHGWPQFYDCLSCVR